MSASPEALAKAREIAESLFYGKGRGRTRTRMYQELCHALHEIDLDAFAAAAVAKEREAIAVIAERDICHEDVVQTPDGGWTEAMTACPSPAGCDYCASGHNRSMAHAIRARGAPGGTA